MPIEEERVIFYCELGKALAEWATVEGSLAEVVKIVVEPKSRPIVGIGFMSIVGMHSKMKFADDAVRRGIHLYSRAEEMGNWQSLIDRIRGQSETRNHLAHYQIAEFPNNNAIGKRIALCPWKYPKQWDKTGPLVGSYCIMEIVKARLEFESLWKSLVNFVNRLIRRAEPHPRSDERASNPPTIQLLRRQTHAALGHQHLSSREKRAIESALNAASSLRPRQEDDDNGTQVEGDAATITPGGRGAPEDVGNAPGAKENGQEEAPEAP